MQRQGILSPDQRDAVRAIQALMGERGIKLREIAKAAPAEDEPKAPLSREQRIKLAQIHTLMEFYAIEPEEIAASLGKLGLKLERRADGTMPTTGPAPSYVKYRHPKTGLTWDGKGDHPLWLREALLREGYRVDELRPENQG